MPMSLFDDLLALFRRKDFRLDQVTIQKPENVMDHIMSQRQLIAEERNSKSPEVTDAESRLHRHPPTPTLIPELLAEYLDSQHIPFHLAIERAAYDRQEPPGGETKRTLEAMSLVHRSWTDIAQRYLRRRFFISGFMPSVLYSPQIGPWVRQLSFYNDEAHRPEGQDMPRLLTGILKRCPNITHLHLHDFRLPGDDGDKEVEIQVYETGHLIETPHDIIAQLADMKHLEHLSLRQSYYMESYHEDFCRLLMILPGLRFLKSLSLHSLDVPWWRKEKGQTKDPTQTGALIPSSSLEALSLVKVDLVASGLFTWLMNPHNNIKRLELSLCDGVDGLLPLFSSATTTHVTTLQFTPPWNALDVGIALQFFPSVQTLSLHGDWEQGLPGISLRLPATIRNFHFYYRQLGDIDGVDQDQIALAILKTYRYIQRMFITYPDNFDPPRVLFENAADYCVRNNVEFIATKVIEDHPPHILEL